MNPDIIQKVQTKVSDQMNDVLMAPFTLDDVRKAVFRIDGLKDTRSGWASCSFL